MATLLITGADLLGQGAQDVLVEHGVITQVGSIRSAKGADVLDADGLVALPGLVDLHTHLREPGREDAETIASGSAAAAVGGFTAVLAMANTSPVTDTAEAAELYHEAERIIVEDASYVFIQAPAEFAVVRNEVGGFVYYPDLVLRLRNMWLNTPM